MIGTSPSAVTGAINELTAVSGMKLFDRHPRGLSLTYEGHRPCWSIAGTYFPLSKAPATP
jgi:hypothetical protein